MNVNVEIQVDKIRLRPENSEVERLWASNKKAFNLIGWSPEYAGMNGFRDGIRKTINWFSKKENLARYNSSLYNI